MIPLSDITIHTGFWTGVVVGFWLGVIVVYVIAYITTSGSNDGS